MTRINVLEVGILSDQHLMAEYRELPRMLPYITAWINQGCPTDKIPSTYVLGKGHMKFFLDKFHWLVRRHSRIVMELVHVRGYNLKHTDTLHLAGTTPPENPIQYTPTAIDISLNQERIVEKLRLRPSFYTWTNTPIPIWCNEAMNLL